VSAAWHARVQQVDPGWVDLGFSVPLLDTGRAARELGWAPTVDGMTVLQETIDGMQDAASDGSPVLRPRTVLGQLRAAAVRGPVSSRRTP
jgi:UDP-glucose 4-epimerase